MERRIIISLFITIIFLLILSIPLIEFVDAGFMEGISMFIHWPLFILGFFGENDGGMIPFLIIWYGLILWLGTQVVNLILGAISKNRK